MGGSSLPPKFNMKFLTILILGTNISASWLVPSSSHKKVTKIQITKLIATNLAIGLVSGLVTKKLVSSKKIESITIFGPGKPIVGAP